MPSVVNGFTEGLEITPQIALGESDVYPGLLLEDGLMPRPEA